MELNRIWPAGVYELGTPPACAQVVEVVRTKPGRTIHVAGTYAMDVDHEFPGDMGAQVHAAMENIRRSLAAVGAGPSDVVRVKSYVTDMRAFQRDGVPEFRKFWANEPPVSTAVQVVALGYPQALIEMEVYAEID